MDDATEPTTIQLRPSWASVVNLARCFGEQLPRQQREGLAAVLDQLSRLARIADGNDPDAMILERDAAAAEGS